MKNIKITIVLLLVFFQAQAQSIQRSVIGSAGKVTSNGGITLRNTIGDAVASSLTNGTLKITQGFQQNIMANNVLPITGMDFFAKRISSLFVKLQWQTISEFNNKGFYIERKLENELDFGQEDFVESKAVNGYSQTPLQYEYRDKNDLAEKTYYRIKQEDLDGKNSFSIIRIINGEPSDNISLKVWPIPSSGFINVQLIGSNSTNEIVIYDSYGKIINAVIVENQEAYHIDGLMPGVYFVSLKGDSHITQKIIVQ